MLTIGECDVLILDEILGLVDLGIIDVSEVVRLIQAKPEGMELILTGRNLPEELRETADYISYISIIIGRYFDNLTANLQLLNII